MNGALQNLGSNQAGANASLPSTRMATSAPLQVATASAQSQAAVTSTPPQNLTPVPNHGTFVSNLKYWLKPTLALLIYALTLYVASTASTRHTALGRVSPSLGNWFLTILAKGGDITFAFAVEDMFDTLTWRKLKQRRRTSGQDSFGGIRLYWFLALLSSTGVEGLVKILMKSLRKRTVRGNAGKWSFIRLLFIVALIPGPGIILMANVIQKEVFFPIRTMDVSGGLGIYDPRIATLALVWKPEISKLVQSMLRDRSISWPIDPVSNECKSNDSCTSYLIAGPYQTVAPWPFTVEHNDVDGFRLYDAPFYQVELWDASPNLTFSESKDCTLYGGLDAVGDYSMIICLAQQSSEGLLAAGWKSCQLGYSPNGTCLMPGTSEGNERSWSTYLQFYRRKATITFSRSEFTIQEVFSLSPPIPQQISPSSLFQSLNTVLYRPNLTSNDPRYDRKSQQYVLTQIIGSWLWSSLQVRLNGLSFARDWLQNLLVMPVYIFQPTVLAVDSQKPTLGFNDNGTLVQPNLPDENYIRGSYCIVDARAVPGWKTVVGYAVVALLVLVFVWTGKILAKTWPVIETSDFPMLDYDVLTMLVDEKPTTVLLRERFDGPPHRGGSVLDAVADLRIGLRNV